SGRADSGLRPASSLREELRDFLSRNRALPHDAPASFFVGEIDNSGRYFARRSAAIDNDGNTILELVAYGHRRGALGFSAEVRRGSGDRDLRRLHDRQRNGRLRNPQGNITCVRGHFEWKT